ncbi:MAG: energy-coupling factor ABC transporter ATP-binding protein [Bryobacterales bacterium]|nr:energy-coupling factor ABC transporter ATP-binding protein [Bryobacterales bacterium]
MTPLIEATGLHYRYPNGTAALNGVDFALQEGETVALFGPNGSGKTTFVLLLNGLIFGTGALNVCGIGVSRKTAAAVRRKIGIVFQDSDEQLFMPTVLEDVTYGLLNMGADERVAVEAARKALGQVGAAHLEQRAPYHLSAGEKRRVALAGVLVMQPDVLILDEPTTFLDPPGQRDLVHLLRQLPQAKILVTHDTEFAGALASRAVFFERGKVLGSGPVEEVIQRFRWSLDYD